VGFSIRFTLLIRDGSLIVNPILCNEFLLFLAASTKEHPARFSFVQFCGQFPMVTCNMQAEIDG
jgi:hypothetical protein